jgi:hypothetical protein
MREDIWTENGMINAFYECIREARAAGGYWHDAAIIADERYDLNWTVSWTGEQDAWYEAVARYKRNYADEQINSSSGD